MKTSPLKSMAKKIDNGNSMHVISKRSYWNARWITFTFMRQKKTAAAFDFQYVGAGCGIKDFIYLLSSLKNEDQLFEQCNDDLEYYFNKLKEFVHQYNKNIEYDLLEKSGETSTH